MALSIPCIYVFASFRHTTVCVRKVYPKMQFSDHEYKPLKNLCDSVFKKLHSKGIGVSLKTKVVLSLDDEKKLWDSNVLNLETFIGLSYVVLCTVFFYNGTNFVCEVVLSTTILNYHSFRERLL